MNFLFYVNAGDEINNFDLAVWARDPDDAQAVWREYYAMEADDEMQPTRIWRMGAKAFRAARGPIAWHKDAICVYGE